MPGCHIPLKAHLLTLPVSSNITEGMGKIFGFQSLHHGTSFPRYVSILKNGADPNRGGEGSAFICKEYVDDSKNYFHTFKGEPKLLGKYRLIGEIYRRVMPRLHAGMTAVSDLKKNYGKITAITLSPIYAPLNFFFSPTLRFMYRSDEISNLGFEDDLAYGSIAYKTKHPLPSDRIGLPGLIKHAKVSDAKAEIKKRPMHVLIGATQVAAGIAFTGCGLGFFL